jgi:hypothetical protein
LAIKKPWPSMARTVWGAHKRYMDTYLNVYKGYYVSTRLADILGVTYVYTNIASSSPVMALVVIMRDTIGFVDVLMML